MKKPFLHRVIRRFCGERDGSVMVETVICLPLLLWALVATYEFFEVFRYRSVREKATYTVADMLSRETTHVNETYMDNALRLFDGISGDDGINQIRVSVLRFVSASNEYEVRWSKVRGPGEFTELVDDDVRTAHDTLPRLGGGEELILVEAASEYKPAFKVGLGTSVPVETRIFTKIRFLPQLCFDGQNECDIEQS